MINCQRQCSCSVKSTFFSNLSLLFARTDVQIVLLQNSSVYIPQCTRRVKIVHKCITSAGCGTFVRVYSPNNKYCEMFLICHYFRWWPCQVLDELDLPDNIFSRPHKPCQFPAICLGTKEFAWLDMSRVYSYEDGDKGSSSSNGMSASFKLGMFITFRVAL